MTLIGSYTNSSAELSTGVEGYFATNGIVNGGPANGATPFALTVSPNPDTVGTSNTYIFTNPDFMGRIVFTGTGLTVSRDLVPVFSDDPTKFFPIFTGGTLTGWTSFFNYRLFDAVNNLGPNAPNLFVLRSAEFLELSSQFVLPNIPAVELGNAVLQAYRTNSTAPIVAFFDAQQLILTGNENINLIAGAGNNDLIDGLGGNDVLRGGGGNDTLIGGPGTDVLDGGPGNDLYLPAPSGEPNVSGVRDQISDSGTAPGEVDVVSYRNATSAVLIDLDFSDGNSSAGPAAGVMISETIEVIEGSPFNDVLIGRNSAILANDFLVGGLGNDTIEGRGGTDVLQGGPGDDFLDGGTNLDQLLNPGPGDIAVFSANSGDVDVYRTQFGSFLVAAPGGGIDELINVELLGLNDGTFNLATFPLSGRQLFRGGPNTEQFDGTPGDDLMFGAGGSDTLIGAAGDDQMEGGDGADTLDGGTGADLMVGGAGGDLYFVDRPGDRIFEFAEGGGVDNVIADSDYTLGPAHIEQLTLRNVGGSRGEGNDLDNRIEGAAGNDTLLGGDGADTLIGNDGNDSIIGGTTDADLRDVVFAGAGNDSVDGGHGNDDLNGMDGNDTMEGGFGADRLVGGAGNDVLTGSAFSDQIFGNDGFDFINGGFGSDRVNGGAGADRFFHVGVAGHGSDWIQDYSVAEGDVLVYGGSATPSQFQVNTTTTAGAGAAGVDEAFVIFRPTGQILWALVDGDGQAEINIQIGGQVFDLLG